jgi:ArsR family transcriptional regulator, arsenate/arsenite/antimonite-responsive transcriptional repressor
LATKRLKVLEQPVKEAGCCAPPSPRLSAEAAAGYARLFKALSDETRVEILGLLAGCEGELCACEIEGHFELSQPTISHHLRLLKEAGLISGERRGTWVYYRIDKRRLAGLEAFQRALG